MKNKRKDVSLRTSLESEKNFVEPIKGAKFIDNITADLSKKEKLRGITVDLSGSESTRNAQIEEMKDYFKKNFTPTPKSDQNQGFQERSEKNMLHHYITKYEEKENRYAESWLQINLFGKCFCFCKKRIKI